MTTSQSRESLNNGNAVTLVLQMVMKTNLIGSYVRSVFFFCAAGDEAVVSKEDDQIKEARLTIERLSRKYLVCC